MNATLIDGNAIRTTILQQLEQDLCRLRATSRTIPGLAVVRVGYDAASSAYLRQKKLAAQALGYNYHEHLFESEAAQAEVVELIEQLNGDPRVHGILLQLPLPAHLNANAISSAIAPVKDVDGLHPANAGRLFHGRDGLSPCTPAGVMRMLEAIGFDPAGKRAVIVGRSNIVGRPIAMLLLAADATVTICHRRSDVPAAVRQADLLVAAMGVPRFIRGEWVKRGAVVIDVGINRVDGELVGDVEFETASKRASYITPVPGGVGALTVAMLMQNTFLAWVQAERLGLSQSPDGCGAEVAGAVPAWISSSPRCEVVHAA